MKFRIIEDYPEFTILLCQAVKDVKTYQHISINTARAKEAFIICVDIIPERIVSEIHVCETPTVLLTNGSVIIFRGADALELGKPITGMSYCSSDML